MRIHHNSFFFTSTTSLVFFGITTLAAYSILALSIFSTNQVVFADSTITTSPSVTIGADQSTLTLGQSTVIHGTFIPSSGDMFTVTDINVITPEATSEVNAIMTGFVRNTEVQNPLNYTFTPTTAGTYTFRAYGLTNIYTYPNWQYSTPITVVVNPSSAAPPIPTISISSSLGTTMSVGQSSTITITGTAGAGDTMTTSATWITPPINAGERYQPVSDKLSPTLTYTFTPTTAGTYIIDGYAYSQYYQSWWGGTTSNAEIIVNVKPPSVVSPPTFYSWPDFGSIFKNPIPFNLEFDESRGPASYGSIPDLGSFMIGRLINNGSTSLEAGFSLTAVQMNWDATPKPNEQYLYKVLDTTTPVSVENDTYKINTAYDANIAAYNGQYWVSFECYGPKGFAGSSAACVGPLAWNSTTNQAYIDPAHISVVAKDFYTQGQKYQHSAAEPKLLVFNGNLYIYWEVTTIDTTPNADYLGWKNDGSFAKAFAKLDARGAQLQLDPSTGLLHVVGSGGQVISSIDPTLSTEVMDDVDITQLIPYNGGILATGPLAPQVSATLDCGSPLGALPWNIDPIPNCYRMFFAEATSPFGPFTVATETGIPTNVVQYYRFVYRPADGKTLLQGGLTSSLKYWDINNDQAYIYEWPDQLLKPVCDPIKQPFPNYINLDGVCISTTTKQAATVSKSTVVAASSSTSSVSSGSSSSSSSSSSAGTSSSGLVSSSGSGTLSFSTSGLYGSTSSSKGSQNTTTSGSVSTLSRAC